MVSNYLEYIISERLDNCIDLEKIFKELEKNYKFYNENEIYKKNIDFLLGCLNENHLLHSESFKFENDKIIIEPYLNSKWIHLYNNRKFVYGVIFKKIIIYKNYYTITINDNLLLDMKDILFNFYE